MKNLLRLCAGLVLVFFLGFFLAGGRDVLRPETVDRVTSWASESVLPSKEPFHAPDVEDADTRLKRLLFLRDAVNERMAAKKIVSADEMPDELLKAIVAVEDARFFSHPGFDIEGIIRATLVNLQHGEIEEGASTITQQLIKNLFLSQEQTFARKAEELALALKNRNPDSLSEHHLFRLRLLRHLRRRSWLLRQRPERPDPAGSGNARGAAKRAVPLFPL